VRSGCSLLLPSLQVNWGNRRNWDVTLDSVGVVREPGIVAERQAKSATEIPVRGEGSTTQIGGFLRPQKYGSHRTGHQSPSVSPGTELLPGVLKSKIFICLSPDHFRSDVKQCFTDINQVDLACRLLSDNGVWNE